MTAKRKHVRVTYSTLSSPDPLLHEYYEEDVVAVGPRCLPVRTSWVLA